MMGAFDQIWWALLWVCVTLQGVASDDHQPLSKIEIHKATFALHDLAYIKVTPAVLGVMGGSSEWVTLEYGHSEPSTDDWIGVFRLQISVLQPVHLKARELMPTALLPSSSNMQLTRILNTRRPAEEL